MIVTEKSGQVDEQMEITGYTTREPINACFPASGQI